MPLHKTTPVYFKHMEKFCFFYKIVSIIIFLRFLFTVNQQGLTYKKALVIAGLYVFILNYPTSKK